VAVIWKWSLGQSSIWNLKNNFFSRIRINLF
jgi:hypothetical protein